MNTIECSRCKMDYPLERKDELFELNKRGVPHKTCSYCRNKDTSYKFNYIKEQMLRRDIECLDTKYVKTSAKMNWKCLKCNLKWKQSYYSLKEGYGCRVCEIKKTKITLKTVEDFTEKVTHKSYFWS